MASKRKGMGYKFKSQRPIISKNIGKVINHIKGKTEVETMQFQHPFPKIIDGKKLGGGLDFGYMDDAKRIIKIFSKEILPLLEKFGLRDDEHVNRYLRHCTSFKDIYNDIVATPGGMMLLKFMQSEKQDFYKLFRSNEYGQVKLDDDRLIYKAMTPEVEAQAALIEQLQKEWKTADDNDSRARINEKIEKASERIERLGWKRLPMTPEDENFKWRRLPQSTGGMVSKIVEGIIYKDGRFSIDVALYEKWSIIEPTDRQRELYDAAAQICEILKRIKYDQELESLILSDRKGNVTPNIQRILGRTAFFGMLGEINEETNKTAL